MDDLGGNDTESVPQRLKPCNKWSALLTALGAAEKPDFRVDRGCTNLVPQGRLKVVQDCVVAHFRPSLRDWVVL
jgi:hypothetical protein